MIDAIGRLESVNTGPVRPVVWGELKRSGIDKRPVAGRVEVGELGLVGDGIGDEARHGGVDQAVYAYAREDLARWEGELGRTLAPGTFGENLTTVDVDVTGARLGERWRVGTTLLEVSGVRIPCAVFAGFLGEERWMRRFVDADVPGAYLRVVEPGTVAAGDAVEVVERRDHDLTVGLAFRALTRDASLLPSLAAEPRASEKIRRKALAAVRHATRRA